MPEEWIEEFYELSGRFIDSGHNIASADDLAVFLMCEKHRALKKDSFKELREAEPVKLGRT